MAYYPYGKFTQIVIVLVGQRLRRSHNNALSSVNAKRIEVLHIAHGYAVVESVAHDFILDLFPSLERFFHKHLRRERQGLFCQSHQLFLIVAKTGSETAESIGRTNNHRIAKLGGSSDSVRHRCHGFTLDSLDPYLIQFFHKQFTVFGVHNSLDGGAEHFHSVFFKDPVLIEVYAAVQSRLSAESEQNAVWTLFFNDTLDKIGCHREEIYLVCKTVRRLDRSNIGIDQDCGDSLLLKSFEGL